MNVQEILSKRSVIAIIIANLIPLLGVLFLGWNISQIVWIYWTENLSVGFFNVLKMGMIALNKGEAIALFLIPFFMLHYGMFTLVQGIFVVFLFGWPSASILPAAFILFLSHGYSFFENFFLKNVAQNRNLGTQMFLPYKRVIVMQLTVILGAIFIKSFGAPIFALVVMVLVKTAVDIGSHEWEHAPLQSDVVVGKGADAKQLNFPKA